MFWSGVVVGLFAGVLVGFFLAGMLTINRFTELEDEAARLRKELARYKLAVEWERWGL